MSDRFKLAHSDEQACAIPAEDSNQVLSEWTAGGFLWEGASFIPSIGSASFCNVETVHLDGSITSSLDFSSAIEKAKTVIAGGKKIFWDLDLGLFGELSSLMQHTGHHNSRLLAIDYFLEKCWHPFKNHTFGLNLYRGFANFKLDFAGNEVEEHSLFSLREIAADYLSLLAHRLPDEILLFICLDTKEMSEAELLQTLHPALFERFLFALKGETVHLAALTFEEGIASYGSLDLHHLPEVIHPKIGLCLPDPNYISEEHLAILQKAIDLLKQRGVNWRVIPESRITAYWDELEELIAIEPTLTFSGKRQLSGFIAADGKVTFCS